MGKIKFKYDLNYKTEQELKTKKNPIQGDIKSLSLNAVFWR